jgi:uncharacterized protein YyaL (SSP411 family)
MTLQRRQDALFWDEAGGGWFSTTGKDPSVLLRLKEDYDGAEPAASSISVLNLLALSHLTGDAAMAGKIERTLGTFGERAARIGRAVPMMLCALSSYHAGVAQIVVAGDPSRAETDALWQVIRHRYLPAAVVVPAAPQSRAALSALLPWTEPLTPRGAAAAYVCRDFTCQIPATTAADLAAQLEAMGEHG